MAFDHRQAMAAKGSKPGSRVKLKDGTTFLVPGFSAVYTPEILSVLAKAGGVEKYTNPKLDVGEVQVTPRNAMAAGEAAGEFVLACVLGVAPAAKPEPQPAPEPEPQPNGKHNRIPAATK